MKHLETLQARRADGAAIYGRDPGHIVPTRAIENCVGYVACNTVGTQRAFTFEGRPHGYSVPFTFSTIVASWIPANTAPRKAAGLRASFFTGRRPGVTRVLNAGPESRFDKNASKNDLPQYALSYDWTATAGFSDLA